MTDPAMRERLEIFMATREARVFEGPNGLRCYDAGAIGMPDALAFAASEVARDRAALAASGERSAELAAAEDVARYWGIGPNHCGAFEGSTVRSTFKALALEIDRLRFALALAEQEKQALRKSADTWRDRWATMNSYYHDRDKEAREENAQVQSLRAEVKHKDAAIKECLRRMGQEALLWRTAAGVASIPGDRSVAMEIFRKAHEDVSEIIVLYRSALSQTVPHKCMCDTVFGSCVYHAALSPVAPEPSKPEDKP